MEETNRNYLNFVLSIDSSTVFRIECLKNSEGSHLFAVKNNEINNKESVKWQLWTERVSMASLSQLERF